MRSVRHFGYSILLAILSISGALSLLWLVVLCGSTHEGLLKSQGSAPLGQYLSLLFSTGDFWRALIFFLLSAAAVAAVALLLRRGRLRRRAEIEAEKLCENETEWEQQP